MIATLINMIMSPALYGTLALLCLGGYVFCKVTLQPMLAFVCEIAGICFLVLACYAWADNRGYARAEAVYEPQLAEAHTAVTQAHSETAQCVAATKVQSQAVADAAARAKAAQDAARATIAKAQAAARQNEARMAELRALASAAPIAQSCEREMADADAIVNESLKARRK